MREGRVMEDMICLHAEKCRMVAALTDDLSRYIGTGCNHDKPHEMTNACKPGWCGFIEEDVECQPIEG